MILNNWFILWFWQVFYDFVHFVFPPLLWLWTYCGKKYDESWCSNCRLLGIDVQLHLRIKGEGGKGNGKNVETMSNYLTLKIIILSTYNCCLHVLWRFMGFRSVLWQVFFIGGNMQTINLTESLMRRLGSSLWVVVSVMITWLYLMEFTIFFVSWRKKSYLMWFTIFL